MKKYLLLKKKISEHYRKALLVVALIGVLLLMLISPVTNQALGNLFFGKVPALYSVTLARFFFKQSAYPTIGKAAEYAHYQLSRSYFIRGDLADALGEAQKELEIYPDHARAYYILGLTYGYMNEEDKAIGAFSKFIEANPDSWAARNDKAWLQFRIGDIDGALETINPVAHDKDNPWVQNTYGTLLMNKKRYAEAKEAFLNAKRITDTMTESAWGNAYPGNDPRIYATGLSAMRKSIESNLKVIEGR
jgi:tetratricopeptide (TPR) repeat protein